MGIHATGRPVALVTGASRGLGLALAGELARRGHDLVVCARDADDLRAARETLSRHGTTVIDVVADVGRKETGEELVDTAEQRFSRLDVLVAGGAGKHSAWIPSFGATEAVSVRIPGG